MCLIVNVIACVVDLVGCVVLVGWVNRCTKGMLVLVDGVILVVGSIVFYSLKIIKIKFGQYSDSYCQHGINHPMN